MTGRRCRQQAQSARLLVNFLTYVTEQLEQVFRVLAQNLQELCAVLQSDIVQPLAADRYRGMVQDNDIEQVTVLPQIVFELTQVLAGNPAVMLVQDPAVEQDQRKPAQLDDVD